ncbi:Cof-type HAD-IIB family hydrolase [Oceanobacillus sp. 143]|uniref:Cof-type HAD-IIB family hydrolase n=1 Tax=Oceanobacillus zhaokaii TaxID=2052660 RepID=A0A345PKK3_9BACI|nr:Cof-type HAD-IIB family hydrolase [Oceanobacillus zhaokaii]AXI10533.1 Cof-type HAD-IIB family hydrolase [Oceanobacillus zhaokaii]QGS69517.1 Cof-type HAD-IIB family hydrolase [Oceanobacillus sp. 143]
MTKKLIFFDIDGTLFDDEKKLPASTKKAIGQLHDQGHEIAIATGRSPFNFKELQAELNIDAYVSFNGQYVVHNNEVIYKNAIDPDKLAELTRFSMEKEHPLVYMNEAEWNSNIESHEQINEAIDSLKVNSELTYNPSFFKGREIYQTLLFCTEENDYMYQNKFPELDFVRWHTYSLDVIPMGGSKANGIEQLVRHLGIDLQDVYAFGDGLNDIEMLKLIPNSIAMGNGHEEAKKVAKYVTKHVGDDGILHGLKMVGLL